MNPMQLVPEHFSVDSISLITNYSNNSLYVLLNCVLLLLCRGFGQQLVNEIECSTALIIM